MAPAWWREHRLRIYHPHVRESELASLDMQRFIYLATGLGRVMLDRGCGD
jgi:hypothetical protein